MCEIISFILLFIGAFTRNEMIVIASGLFAIGAEIAVYRKEMSNRDDRK